MCFGRSVRCIGYALLILALLCIVANILLYFPNGETKYASYNQLSKYVGYLHGIIGGGILVLIPACMLIGLEYDYCNGCFVHEHCGRSCSLLVSVVLAGVGILGAAYCFIVSALALAYRPHCYTRVENVCCYPTGESSGGYVIGHSSWPLCPEQVRIVKWNVTLFAILLVLSGIELILCIIQIIHGCVGGVCTMCCGRKETLEVGAAVSAG
ncbi:transmembrane 4 L6 family member 1 [Tiliqua scincoides]|uniref:transmembrane 4 L6 family member 1 n=1 Tax=Tiliqua scincoides TaxID=71010 RepID=UPI00346319CD